LIAIGAVLIVGAVAGAVLRQLDDAPLPQAEPLP
jgi:hypothetical protein